MSKPTKYGRCESFPYHPIGSDGYCLRARLNHAGAVGWPKCARIPGSKRKPTRKRGK